MRRNKKPFFILMLVGTLLMAPITTYGQSGGHHDPVVTKSYLDSIIKEAFKNQETKLTKLDGQFENIKTQIELIKSQEPPFSDVKNHWAERNINYLFTKGIIGGFDDGTFKPDDTVTRGQLAAMLVRAQGLANINLNQQENPFTDVPATHWAAKEILIARQAGIISGYNDGTFKPDNQVTRAEIAAMLDRAFILEGQQQPMVFKDVDKGFWAKGHIDNLAKSGVTAGYSDGTFKPANPATRAEVATFISRALDPQFR